MKKGKRTEKTMKLPKTTTGSQTNKGKQREVRYRRK
jgi:hypothetical protein